MGKHEYKRRCVEMAAGDESLNAFVCEAIREKLSRCQQLA